MAYLSCVFKPQVAADEDGEHRDAGDILDHRVGVHGGLANTRAAGVPSGTTASRFR